jgi:tRNA U34 2-thiouridine synthase MnmA/TrmU
MAKAISLLSGGLDSILATKLILEQGIEVEAVNFVTVFCTCTARGRSCLVSKSAADNLGIKLKVFEISQEYFEVVKNPKYGYGKNLNPCLDCRIFMFKKAAQYMREVGASFLITGEVLGERPMSQRKETMRIIESDSGLEGLILRPLSARLLEPSIPEKEGLIDRQKLLSIKGRSRKPQMQLAKELGINDYPCPAGGCLLTDAGFANRMRDLIKHTKNFTINDVKLLKVGRHFRLSSLAKLIVGRNEEENNRLLMLVKENDLRFYPTKRKGPVGIGRGNFDKKQILTASGIVARYCDKDLENEIEIAYGQGPDEMVNTIDTPPIEDEGLSVLRI